MKLQVAFDILDIDKALNIASKIEKYVDIFEVGSLLIYKYGISSIEKFKENFPQKTILADTKITDHAKDCVVLFSQNGADWITVLSGAGKNTIQTACTIAHEFNKKIMLDLKDASSPGQYALEAKSLGVDALLMHKTSNDDNNDLFFEKWEMVKGNTNLPIFISTFENKDNITESISLGAYAIVISRIITQAENPEQEVKYIYDLISK